MLNNLVGNSLWYLVYTSDWISKGVLLTLFIMSILCWTVFLGKCMLQRLRMRDMRRVQEQLQAVRSLNDVNAVAVSSAHTVPGRFLSQILLVLNTLKKMQPDTSKRNWDLMQYHIDQATDALLAHEESYLSLLSTSAAVATLLGLFGTVWGLIHSFISISERQSADITVVAPGIAAALLTTLAGLIVAIPALVMYNYLMNQVRTIEMQIMSVADKVSFIMQQALLG